MPGGVPAELFPSLPTGVRWGLERIEALLAERGDPHHACPSIHVAGTNGKGSTAAFIASVLHVAGLRTGLYTSPHLCRFAERILVGGEPLPDERLLELAAPLREGLLRHGLSFFEAATAVAFEAFRAKAVDVAVVEVGLGGRLDATNVIRPEVAVVTNVSMDHADFLGDTLAEIAAEKAGVAKAGVPLLTTESAPEVLAVLRREAEERGAELEVVRAEEARSTRPTDTGDPSGGIAIDGPGATDGPVLPGVRFRIRTRTWGALDLETGMPGRHQATNAALAVRALDALPERLRPSAEDVARGVRWARWPGRLQREQTAEGPWLLDVAHNEAGAETLVQALDELLARAPPVVLVGVLGDKAWQRMLPPLLERAAHAVLTCPDSAPAGRAWDPADAAAVLTGTAGSGTLCSLEVEPDFGAAFRRARERAGGELVVVTGSSYTVGDALRRMGRCPFVPHGRGAPVP